MVPASESCCCQQTCHPYQLIVQPCALHRPDHERLVGATQQLCWLVHIPVRQHTQRAGLGTALLSGAQCVSCPPSRPSLPGWPAYAVNQLIPDVHGVLLRCTEALALLQGAASLFLSPARSPGKLVWSAVLSAGLYRGASHQDNGVEAASMYRVCEPAQSGEFCCCPAAAFGFKHLAEELESGCALFCVCRDGLKELRASIEPQAAPQTDSCRARQQAGYEYRCQIT
jgi:hypothetical protein